MSISKLYSDILATICGLVEPEDLQLMKGEIDVKHSVACGYLDIIKYLRNSIQNIYVDSIQGGHLHVLQWAFANGYDLNQPRIKDGIYNITAQDELCMLAAHYGHIEILQWLVSIGCTLTHEVCSSAAYANRFNVLQWARANGCPWNYYTCMSAASSGNLDMLKWAHDNGCPCTCEAAQPQAAA